MKDICEQIDDFLAEGQVDEGFFSKLMGTLRIELGKTLFNKMTIGALKARIRQIPDMDIQRQAEEKIKELEQYSKELNVVIDQLFALLENYKDL